MQALAIALAAIFGISAALIPVLIGYTMQHHAHSGATPQTITTEPVEEVHKDARTLQAA